jgi:hypothetical protein
MLVSKSHGFYFLKAAKTGGTTIECVLGQLCTGDDDIITKFRLTENTDSAYRKGECKEFTDEFVEHTSYAELTERMDVSDLTPIIAIRHPYEICASECSWCDLEKTYGQNGSITLRSHKYIRWKYNKRFLDPNTKEERGIYNQYSFYGDAIHHPDLITIRFSHLEEDLNNLCDQYDIPAEIPHTKKSGSYTFEKCKKIFTQTQLEHIQEYFADEFAHWGWEK